MKHSYAEILHAIAEGKEIQIKTTMGKWIVCGHETALGDILAEIYSPGYFRIKPVTIQINGVKCEAPEEVGGEYGLDISTKNIGCGKKKTLWFTSREARDAVYAALIKPFENNT